MYSSRAFEIADGRVIVGTRREGAMDQHTGRPDKVPPLPQRRLWPDTSDWPHEWWDAITAEVQDGVVDMVVQQVK